MKLVVQEDTSLYTTIKLAVLDMTIAVYWINYRLFMDKQSFVIFFFPAVVHLSAVMR